MAKPFAYMALTNHTKPVVSALGLTLGALGVVFGDIGTSPLYAFEQVFNNPLHPVPVTEANVLGILSLFAWSLLLVVTFKYVLFVMRFDNAGEGGIVALMTLLISKVPRHNRLRVIFVPLGLLGAAFFYGDGVITPAISVLSAVEGLQIISPQLDSYVIPISLVILGVLFLFQRQGTARIAKLFGPVMLIWFVVIAALGISAIVPSPAVLSALSPVHAWAFVQNNAGLSFFVLGSVVLCMTGAEALYADMGHFGAKPIQRAWILLVFPALLMNYLGQGAIVLAHPENIHNPFFRLAPDWAIHGLVVLATIATVVASQAVISGVFSMTQQLVQLRFLPRLVIKHTSDTQTGQIYVPAANWIMLALVIALVLIFQSSNALGAAYGIAVTGTMLITDFFVITILIHGWRWHWLRALGLVAIYVVIDGLFFGANAVKIFDGGWFPVVLSAMILLVMVNWRKGVEAIVECERQIDRPLIEFLKDIVQRSLYRSPGTGVYLTSDESIAPSALVAQAERLHVMPKKVICLHIEVLETPFVSDQDRYQVQALGDGIYKVNVEYGFRDTLDIPEALRRVFPEDDPVNDYDYTSNRHALEVQPGQGWAVWRKRFFLVLFRNAISQSRAFQMPANRVLELGSRLVI
jgi:KUP system potassium uptake protein